MNLWADPDIYFMSQALSEARRAMEEDEVPIGAVVVSQGKVIGRGFNHTEALTDVTAHAEILALTAAQNHLGAKFLTDCTLYVTVEPCVMCAGAIRWSRPARVVWGADEPKFGYRKFSEEILHPRTEIRRGVMAEECLILMREFFSQKR